jgi:hypothetical protein
MEPKWKKDGIRGFDSIIRVDGKVYKKHGFRISTSYKGMPDARKRALAVAGKDGKVYKVNNTYSYAIYLPYTGAERPIQR